MAEVLELDCVVCDRVFSAKRSDARFCGDACRKRASRTNKRDTTAVPAEKESPSEPLGTVVPPPRHFIDPKAGRANRKPLRLSDEEYAERLKSHLAQCVEGHEWHRWPAGLVSCLRCYSQLVAPDD